MIAKDVVKAVKRRLQHKSSKVQFLALTLLETMVKNCGDYVHVQIAERNILGEMVKIVRKKVREKILILLDCWQEAFGGPGGKHPQYYWACEELRRSGVEFPKHSLEAPAIFTPPVTQTTLRHAQAGYGMPSNSSRRLDETMATEMENLSLSSLDSMRNVMELLSDMLQAVNPSDRMAIKDEVIVDLVNRCRANQKKLMQMLTTTGDEELLARGLDLNDGLQSLLAKHDAIVSGLPVPTQATNVSPQPTEKSLSSSKHTEVKDSSASDSSPKPNTNLSATVGTMTKVQIYEDEEEEDEFAQLARSDDGLALVSTSSTINPSSTTATSVPSNALALPDPPAQVKTTKEQDMIDLLSITLSTTAASPDTTPHAPASNPQAAPSNGNMHQVPVSPSVQGNPYPSQPYPGNLGMASQNSYVVPWAQPQPQLQQQFRPQLQPQTQPQFQSQFQPQTQPQFHSQFQPQYSSGYPPPPWAATPGYSNNQNHLSANNMFSTPRANATTSYMPAQGARPLQHFNSFPARGINGSDNNGGFPVIPGPRSPAPAAGQKPFVPSYRLFEDLNVFGNADGKFKITNSNTSSSLSGTAGQGMVGGRK
ncbi:Target of Myb protein 1 [Prunus dulcis]|uniref:Target of Myb protein 1 n=1 Tax=Prunus dulcis TaxID=3755 RepID=A0A4Y1RPQ1_PRUDU|nr:Target of Myb protein 1 [Prunus dulcis]